MSNFIAIDYGSKMAGTTVICFAKKNKLHFLQSAKKKDADAFLKKNILALNPEKIFMDAPLSLPGVYFAKGDNYFYRQCDREVGGMSPMFLGGLTARAMQLKAGFPEVLFFEIYPAHLVRVLFLKDKSYKKNMTGFCEMIKKEMPVGFFELPKNWHQVDAALGWLSGWRYLNEKAEMYGDQKEGVIYV